MYRCGGRTSTSQSGCIGHNPAPVVSAVSVCTSLHGCWARVAHSRGHEPETPPRVLGWSALIDGPTGAGPDAVLVAYAQDGTSNSSGGTSRTCGRQPKWDSPYPCSEFEGPVIGVNAVAANRFGPLARRWSRFEVRSARFRTQAWVAPTFSTQSSRIGGRTMMRANSFSLHQPMLVICPFRGPSESLPRSIDHTILSCFP